MTSPQNRRILLVDDMPTIHESGYPGFEVESWRGVYAPAGTPREVIARLNREYGKALVKR